MPPAGVIAKERGSSIVPRAERSPYVLVHIDPDDLPLDSVMIEISLPDDIRSKRATANGVLTESAHPAFPVYIVPSTIIREENNIILFPGHAEFRAAIVSTMAFEFDDRLFKRRTR